MLFDVGEKPIEEAEAPSKEMGPGRKGTGFAQVAMARFPRSEKGERVQVPVEDARVNIAA